MYIEPRTNIRLLHNVPLDTTYEHTIYFDSKDEQSAYFIGLQKYNLTNYSYQRVNKGVARVGIKADSLYDCNYLMFQNTSFGNKWFYGFITAVEYINNECSEISFEIDVMQTWFFEHTPQRCFVEREHSVSDEIGENIIPENVETGEYVFNGYGKLSQALDPLAVVVMVCDTDEAPNGTLQGGVYGGCTLTAFNSDDTDGITELLKTYAQKPDSVVSIYTLPVIGATHDLDVPLVGGGVEISFNKECAKLNTSFETITKDMSLNGYHPKNKKLYTYPYNFLQVSSGKTSNIYRFEFFNNLTPEFEIDVPVTMPIQVALRPKNYKGSSGNTLNSETLILDDFPLCSWSTDAFRAWVAQNSLPIATGVGLGIGAIGLAMQGVSIPIMAGAVGVSKITSLLSNGYKASIASDIQKGSINSGSVDVASGKKNFYGGRCSVSFQYARVIDEFFTMYGYATNRVKIPNRSSRPHWNYVKTVDCTLTGSVPADDMRKLCSIYDSGVTFWKKGNEVGNYGLDNTP